MAPHLIQDNQIIFRECRKRSLDLFGWVVHFASQKPGVRHASPVIIATKGKTKENKLALVTGVRIVRVLKNAGWDARFDSHNRYLSTSVFVQGLGLFENVAGMVF